MTAKWLIFLEKLGAFLREHLAMIDAVKVETTDIIGI